MSEKPILFLGAMVRAILEGRKSMTRRVIKPQPDCCHSSIAYPAHRYNDTAVYAIANGKYMIRCPYGKPGDVLYVKETWRHSMHKDYTDCICYRADNACKCGFKYAENEPAKWKPSLFMRRDYARIFLRVTSVRVERLQDITEADAMAEGVEPITMPRHHPSCDGGCSMCPVPYEDYQYGFQTLWDSLNSKRGYGWDANPWLWVISFERLK